MISKIKYLELCKLFNSILKSPESNLETIAIPWLHIIREHPIFLSRYKKIFKYSFYELFFSEVKKNIYLLLQFYKSLFAKKETVPAYTNNSFMYDFLSSFRDKVNAPFKKKSK